MAAGSDNTIIGMSGDDHLDGGSGSLPGGAGADSSIAAPAAPSVRHCANVLTGKPVERTTSIPPRSPAGEATQVNDTVDHIFWRQETEPTTTLKVTFVSESAAYKNHLRLVQSRLPDMAASVRRRRAGRISRTAHAGRFVRRFYGEYLPISAISNSSSYRTATISIERLRRFYRRRQGHQLQTARGRRGCRLQRQREDQLASPTFCKAGRANALFTENLENAGGVEYASSVAGSNQTAATLAGESVRRSRRACWPGKTWRQPEEHGIYTKPVERGLQRCRLPYIDGHTPPAAVASPTRTDRRDPVRTNTGRQSRSTRRFAGESVRDRKRADPRQTDVDVGDTRIG
jgi:hypothetical protein